MEYRLNFDNIAAGTAAAASGTGFEWVSGSGTFLHFSTGGYKDISLQNNAGTGEAMLALSNEPIGLHQSAEARFVLGRTNSTGTLGSTARTGVFVCAQSFSNAVIAYFDHNTKLCKLVERISGSDTVLGTVDFDMATGGNGAAIKLEVIDGRARVTFEPRRVDVEDKPPEIAAWLTGTYANNGAWGIYFKTNSTSDNMEVENFVAKDLPRVCMPAPDFIVESASGLNLVPVEVTLTNVPTYPYEFEWQVFPKDPDDFAEGYSDLSIYNLTTRTFFIRPGFEYTIRARCLGADGVSSDWASTTIVSTGTKPTSSPDQPALTFPDIIPSYVLSRTQSAMVDATVADGGRERVSSKWVRPRNKWTLKFSQSNRDDVNTLLQFYKDAKGNALPFVWTHPTSGEQFNCRFDVDEPGYTIEDEGLEDGDSPVITIEFPIAEVGYNVVGTLAVTLELDSSLRP